MRRMSSINLGRAKRRGNGRGGGGLPLWRWLHSWWGNNPGCTVYVTADKDWGVCACVCGGWGCHWSHLGLNLPRIDRGRWIQPGPGWGRGCRMERTIPCSDTDRHRGATHNPNRGFYSKPAGLALSYAGHLFNIVSCHFIVLFQVSLVFSFPFFKKKFSLLWAPAGAAGRNFLAKQRNGTGEFSQHYLSPLFSLTFKTARWVRMC